jgi:hypothetical protein
VLPPKWEVTSSTSLAEVATPPLALVTADDLARILRRRRRHRAARDHGRHPVHRHPGDNHVAAGTSSSRPPMSFGGASLALRHRARRVLISTSASLWGARLGVRPGASIFRGLSAVSCDSGEGGVHHVPASFGYVNHMAACVITFERAKGPASSTWRLALQTRPRPGPLTLLLGPAGLPFASIVRRRTHLAMPRKKPAATRSAAA